jgi:hypothetical protein
VANRATERLPAGTNPADYGEAVTTPGTPSGTYSLISMLTSPLTAENRQDYVVVGIPPANAPNSFPTAPQRYRWTVLRDSTTSPMALDTHETEIGMFSDTFHVAPDTVHVTVELLLGPNVLATLSLDQTVQARRADVDAFITQNKLDRADAIHELVSDLRPYVDASVVASGATGVPARLVAAVLYGEMEHRWREGTDGAKRYRKALAEGRAITGPPKSKAEELFGPEDDMVREVENEVGAWGLNPVIGGQLGVLSVMVGAPQLAGLSMGVGQIRQYVAAMVLFGTTSQSAYDGLSHAKKVEAYNHLRFPKTNVGLATKLLTSLKTRNRTGGGPTTVTTPWKTMTRHVMVNEEEPCTAVAQEYNTGATNSYTRSLGRRYGMGVWKRMSSVLPFNAAVFFPEPP